MPELFLPENKEYPIRIALCVEYDGSAFNGWQTQNSGVPTVQQALERALSKVANHPVSVVCAGRTDTGVHGTKQIIHFDTKSIRKPYGWIMGANQNLPGEVSVQWAKEVNQFFHARFSATDRRYRYIIYNAPIMQGILRKGMTWHRHPLDETKMQAGADYLVGRHDFTSFRAADCQANSPVKTIKHLKVMRQGPLVVIDVKANAFLYHMVRNIAGVLLPIGSGVQPAHWAKEVLEAKDRGHKGVTAPPHGLYFVDVDYDKSFDLPQDPLGPGFAFWVNSFFN